MTKKREIERRKERKKDIANYAAALLGNGEQEEQGQPAAGCTVSPKVDWDQGGNKVVSCLFVVVVARAN